MTRLIQFSILFYLALPFLYSQEGSEKKAFPETGSSSFIQKWTEHFKANPNQSTEAFWKEVTKIQTPILEDIPDQSNKTLATFLWKGDSETKKVMILFSTIEMTDNNYFKSIEGTDIWFQTFVLPKGMRNSYMISPNDPKGIGEWSHRKTWQNDPFNPHTFLDDPGGHRGPYSGLALPGATPQPFTYDQVQAYSQKGHIEEVNLHSKYMKQERKFWIYIPFGYNKNKGPYPLIVNFDGGVYLNMFPRKTAFDNMISKKDIPPSFVVFIQQKSRSRELKANENFADFVVLEVLPALRSRYHVTIESKQSIITGSSNGGRAASYVALRYPDTFSKVLSQSGNYGGEEGEVINQAYLTSEKKNILHYLTAGTLEQWVHERNTRFKSILDQKGYTYHYEDFHGTHTYFSRQGTLVRGLKYLFSQ